MKTKDTRFNYSRFNYFGVKGEYFNVKSDNFKHLTEEDLKLISSVANELISRMTMRKDFSPGDCELIIKHKVEFSERFFDDAVPVVDTLSIGFKYGEARAKDFIKAHPHHFEIVEEKDGDIFVKATFDDEKGDENNEDMG